MAVRGTDDQLQLDVYDEGRGFDPAVALATSGLGLVSMQERLRFMNGEIAIESKPGAGTTITATVPLRSRVTTPGENTVGDAASTGIAPAV